GRAGDREAQLWHGCAIPRRAHRLHLGAGPAGQGRSRPPAARPGPRRRRGARPGAGRPRIPRTATGRPPRRRRHGGEMVPRDPGRAVNLHVRVEDSAAARFARAFRDLLRSDDGQRQQYLELKRELIARTNRPPEGHDPDVNRAATNTYAEAKEPYFLTMRRRL